MCAWLGGDYYSTGYGGDFFERYFVWEEICYIHCCGCRRKLEQYYLDIRRPSRRRVFLGCVYSFSTGEIFF